MLFEENHEGGARIMQMTIITGTTRGLGLELVKGALALGHQVISVARKQNTDLLEFAESAGSAFKHYNFDLSFVSEIGDLMDDIFSDFNPGLIQRAVLINNAGVVEPIGPFYQLEDHEVLQNVTINLVAPLMLAKHFGRHTRALGNKAVIFNLSSGAGRNPVYGWNSYCVSKAGIDMMTRVIAHEEGLEGLQIVAFEPGVMDTAMQETIRKTDPRVFKELDRFLKLKSQNRLRSPADVANVVLRLIESGFEQGGIVSIADLEVKTND
jgi:benzil reductase ((S)-benzoin forming)